MREPDWTFSATGHTVQNIRDEFAARLYYFMNKKGWNQSQLARQAGMHRDNISRYMKAGHMPNREGAEALARVLETDLSVLIPGQTARTTGNVEMPEGANITPADEHGWVRLKMNQRVPQQVAFKILGLLAEVEPHK